MSSSDIAISVRSLGKSYTIAHNAERHVTLAEAIFDRLRHPFRRQQTETFHALHDISFDVRKGDVSGIIGRNGAGKSTLLKILSRITEPTRGEIDLFGRVGSLLEVGTGFHPELTGRENIYLNGHILGMRRMEIDRQFDAIVDFAGVEQFLDTPVKRYSSGMYVRLAFAVAAHLDSEILVVDEVLAVGDAEFQRKCIGKMQDVASCGRTVLFVSHNMGSVATLCNHCVLLRDGHIQREGDTAEVVACYQEQDCDTAMYQDLAERHRRGTGAAMFRSLQMSAFTRGGKPLPSARPGCDLVVDLTIAAFEDIGDSSVGVIISDSGTGRLVDINSAFDGTYLRLTKGRSASVSFRLVNLLLRPGIYALEVWLGRSGIEMTDWIERVASFSVVDDPDGTGAVRVYHAPYLCEFEVAVYSDAVSPLLADRCAASAL